MKYFKCYSLRIAGKLARRGFDIQKTELNYINPKLLVYLFEDTPEFRQAFDEILTAQQQEQR